MRKIIAGLLAIVLSIVAFSGCTENPETSSSDNITATTMVEKRVFNGIHQLIAHERTDDFISNGKCDYALLVPEEADVFINTAKNELLYFIEQATGLKLRVVTESGEGLTHTATGKYISIGNTKMFASSGIELDTATLKTDGVRIVTKDNTVYLNGGTRAGTLYAAYTFLRIMFNWEIYAEDCWVIDENVKNLKMRDFDVLDIPDIQLRPNFWGAVQANSNNIAYRFRMPDSHDAYLMPVGDRKNGGTPRTIHNSFEILPPASQYAESQWYADDRNQLCYTAHGDTESYDRMVKRIAEVIKDCLVANNPTNFPLYEFCTLTIQDGSDTACVCDACTVAKEKYGSNSGAIIVMCNRVMEELEVLMELPENQPYKRDGFKLAFFAYHSYFDAPAHYDEETKTFVPNHEDLIMRDDVAVYIATSSQTTGFVYKTNIYNEINTAGRNNLLGWAAISHTIYLWTYQTNFQDYLSFSSTFNFYNTDGFQFLASLGAKIMSNQGTSNSMNYTGFQALKPFLDYKMRWNSSLDSDKLIEEWFEAMYREATPIMKELYFDEMQHDIAWSLKVGRWVINSHTSVISEKAYPLNLLTRWLNILDEAYAVAEKHYKNGNPETYAIIKNHIDMEWVYPGYRLLKYYTEDSADPEMIAKAKEYFKTTISRMASYKVSENGGDLNSWILKL